MPGETNSSNQSYADRLRGYMPRDQVDVSLWLATAFDNAATTLVDRSNGNPDLIEAVQDFVRTLDMRAGFDDGSEPLRQYQQDELTTFFRAATNRLSGRYPDGTHYTGWTILPIDESTTADGVRRPGLSS